MISLSNNKRQYFFERCPEIVMKNLKSVRDLFGVRVGEGRLCSTFYGNIHVRNGRQRCGFGKEYWSLQSLFSRDICVAVHLHVIRDWLSCTGEIAQFFTYILSFCISFF